MPFLPFQGSAKKKAPSPRWFAGINITSNCRRIEAAMVGVHGRGSGAPVEIRKAISFDLPPEITESYNELHELVSGETQRVGGNHGFSLYHHVLRELASVEEEAMEELLNESRLTKNDVLAVGVHDAGLRCSTPGGVFYQSLCDATFLAEQTGMNIVDAFPLQDMASRGNGGPLTTLPAWIFLKSDTRDRILLDLGRTARATFLPSAKNTFSHQRIRYQDIVPCGSLLDSLTWDLTQGKTTIDVGGRLTVQGCQIPGLLAEFQHIEPSTTHWHPLGIPAKPYLKTAAAFGRSGHSCQDILCTASGFIAETVTGTLHRMMAEWKNDPGDGHVEPEILLCGSGRLHGMLMNQISSQLHNKSLATVSQLGFPTETFDALCVAMLTLMAVDQIPSNLPSLTGAETNRSLGRLTAGSAGNWQRLLQEMAEVRPGARSLRSAV